MAILLQGIGVSRGTAIGPVRVLQRGDLEIAEYVLPAHLVHEEVARYRFALNTAREQLREIRCSIPESAPRDIAAFIDTYLLMLDDTMFTEAPVDIIRRRQCNAEWALKMQRDALVRVFDEMDDEYLRTRRDDIDHLVHSILRTLAGQPAVHEPEAEPGSAVAGHIVVAADLTPAETVLLFHQGITGIVTEGGGPTAHTAILARSLQIPAVMGVPLAVRLLADDETVVVDGEDGRIWAGLDTAALAVFEERRREAARRRAALARTREAPSRTRDGVTVTLRANIELPEDLDRIAEVGAAGVGLYRTEFLYMNRRDPPDEEEQYATYAEVVRRLAGTPLTIRTLDLGADKGGAAAANPALGLRGIRLCLHEPGLFVPQLRAILRAAALGPVRIMLPMVSTVAEVRQTRRLVEQTAAALAREGLAHDPRPPIGIMVEVPGAALHAAALAREADFMSLGTNDLIQYTLAIDRIDESVSYLYDPLHPAVLHLVHHVIDVGRRLDVPVAMCGEMAGDPRLTPLLLGMGLTEFSMLTTTLLEVKDVITHSDYAHLAAEVDALLACDDADAYYTRLEQFLQPLAGA